MTLTRKRKALLVLLGLGLTAVAVDRVFILDSSAEGGHYAVAGQQGASPFAAVETAGAPVADPAASSPPPVPLVDRFEAAAAKHDYDLWNVADAFKVPEFWEQSASTDAAEPPALAANAFVRRHRLNAVMVGRGRAYAVVDGRLLYADDEIDGYRLISIEERAVTFESHAGHVVLDLDPSP